MTDLFEEVEEQLRSDRYKQLGRKLLPWMLGIAAAALIATLGYWAYDTWRTEQTSKASEQYVAAMGAMSFIRMIGDSCCRARRVGGAPRRSPGTCDKTRTSRDLPPRFANEGNSLSALRRSGERRYGGGRSAANA